MRTPMFFPRARGAPSACVRSIRTSGLISRVPSRRGLSVEFHVGHDAGVAAGRADMYTQSPHPRLSVNTLLVFAWILLLPTAALAQSAIAGVVKDSSGAVLPGVTVEASSDAL